MAINLHKCIFCLEESENFNTIEHIVSESLGNKEDILYDAVCDKCQNYLGKEVENFVLSKTMLAYYRTIYNIRTKKGKEPFYDISLDNKEKGAISNYHPLSDSNIIMHPASFDDKLIIAADVFDKDIIEKLENGEKTSFRVVLTPKKLVYLGRYLGKIALEY